jgi:hypothetical protein
MVTCDAIFSNEVSLGLLLVTFSQALGLSWYPYFQEKFLDKILRDNLRDQLVKLGT